MGRGRAPCCAKIGLNKGSWTPEEDIRLIGYIQKHGHANWRALPKYAGLLRCGKSCRLRWINYLRPDIKRGNFTMGEEETIIKLHNLLGNKWSKIAACLPGRTDNEIKNVWNTHLKKRLASRESPTSSSSVSCSSSSYSSNVSQDVGQGPGQTPGDIAQEEALEIPEIEIEPEIWSMIDSSSELWEEKESNKNSESREWLDYLEKELGLWEAAGEEEEEEEEEDKQDGVEMDGVDPVASYFQKGPSNIYN